MNETKDGGPAFPIADPHQLEPRNADEMKRLAHGMSLRDQFAIAAAQRLDPPEFLVGHSETRQKLQHWAWRVWQMADAMLEARGK